MPSTAYKHHSYRRFKGEPAVLMLGRDPLAAFAINAWLHSANENAKDAKTAGLKPRHSYSKRVQMRKILQEFERFKKTTKFREFPENIPQPKRSSK